MTVTATTADVERMLRAGRAPRDVATELQEPLNDVLAVWHRLRKEPASEQARPAAPIRAVPTPATNPPDTQPAPPGHELVARGLMSGDKRISHQAAKVQAGLDRLREQLEQHDAKAAVRAEVARLEQQLAAAKAKLRGSATPIHHAGARSTKSRTFENRLDCAKCGRTSPTAQGRAAHERHCTGAA